MSEVWVYLPRCSDGSLYSGWTIDLERRLARHRAGAASRCTASRLPVELAHAMPMPDRKAARREEARVKQLSRPDKLASLSAAQAPGTTSAGATPADPGGARARPPPIASPWIAHGWWVHAIRAAAWRMSREAAAWSPKSDRRGAGRGHGAPSDPRSSGGYWTSP
jgi:putative endonuclease